MRVLIVEDEATIAQSVAKSLTDDGYIVSVAQSGEDGLFLLMSESFALLILDIMLPGRSGLELLQTLRKRGITIPVIILSAKDTVHDKIAGLDSGADDYLVKPFSLLELKARVRALLRREKPEAVTTITIGNVEIDLLGHTVTCDGILMDFTLKEYDLFEYLARYEGQIVSRDMIARDIWGGMQRATSLDNVIDVHVGRLRKKLKSSRSSLKVETIRGLGFRLMSSQG